MPVNELIEKILRSFDPYSRVARVYPALLALGPIAWTAIILSPNIVDTAAHSAIFVIAASCLLYFLSSITRARGNAVEKGLLRKWGGWPTTVLLRHGDATFDSITKMRYHKKLSELSELSLPSAAEEKADLDHADAIYRSATKMLIEQRRGPDYRLIHIENASYGFSRNLLGLKPVALVETLILTSLTAGAWWLVTPQPYSKYQLAMSVITYPYLPALIAADVGYGLIWIWAITDQFVWQAGQEYAEALFRTLDSTK